MKLYVTRAPANDKTHLQEVLGADWRVFGMGDRIMGVKFTEAVVEGPLQNKFEHDWYDQFVRKSLIGRKEPLLLRCVVGRA